MTDLETFKAMLDRAKIEYSVEMHTKAIVGNAYVDQESTVITVEDGYAGFYTTIEFDAEGSLKEMGAYE